MSLFNKLLRSAAATAFLTLGSGYMLGQDPAIYPGTSAVAGSTARFMVQIPNMPNQEPVTPASGFGRGGILNRQPHQLRLARRRARPLHACDTLPSHRTATDYAGHDPRR